MANANHGSMTITMRNADRLTGANVFAKKNSGSPVIAAAPKHIFCLRVKPMKNRDFIPVKSFEIDTKAISRTPEPPTPRRFARNGYTSFFL
jgi:hypothetical protein